MFFILRHLCNVFLIVVFQTMVVLNPLKQADCTIMTDTDLAGPLVFCLAFGGTLLLVCTQTTPGLYLSHSGNPLTSIEATVGLPR